jgi:hypothetical protein
MDTPTTQAPYEIARYLSDEAKRAAVARSYEPTPTPLGYTALRCAEGGCPLGVALRAMGRDDGLGWCPPAPDEDEVAAVLGPDNPPLADLARAFIEAWDSGRITDLAAALGVTDER